MKTLLRSLACGALCCLGVTSCVYDDYYGYAGAPVGGYYGRSYSPGFYSPGFSSLSVGYYGASYPYYGGYGYPYGYGTGFGSWPYRYTSYYGSRSPYYGRSRYDWDRYGSRSYPYSARYSRPSTFRGSTVTTTPRIPSVSPRTFTRPSSSSSRFTAPSRSVPAPSGRVSRPLTTVSRSLPSVGTRTSATVRTPPASVRASTSASTSNATRWFRGR